MPVEKDITDFVKSVEKTIDESLSRKQLTILGKATLTIIYKRTKKGIGVRKTGSIGKSPKKLKPLADSTIARRKAFKRLSSTTSPGKSNLTFTGQLLDSLKVKKISARKKSFVISPEGKRRGGSIANFEVAEFVDENGRPFLGLTKDDVKDITKLYQSSFAKLVRKRLT
jgi:phage gpG-like protein